MKILVGEEREKKKASISVGNKKKCWLLLIFGWQATWKPEKVLKREPFPQELGDFFPWGVDIDRKRRKKLQFQLNKSNIKTVEK